VPKNNGTWRLVVDYRRLNAVLVPCACPAPPLSQLAQSLVGRRWYATFDLPDDFFQVALDALCASLFTFVLNGKTYRPTRVQMGARNSTTALHEGLTVAFQDMTLWIYVDDFLPVDESPVEVVAQVRELFERCRKYAIVLSLKKCCLATQKAHWCGYTITPVATRPTSSRSSRRPVARRATWRPASACSATTVRTFRTTRALPRGWMPYPHGGLGHRGWQPCQEETLESIPGLSRVERRARRRMARPRRSEHQFPLIGLRRKLR